LKQIKSEVNVISLKCEKFANSIEQIEEYSYQYNVKIIAVPQEQQTETAEQISKLCLGIFRKIGAEVHLLNKLMNFQSGSQQPFALVFDYSALLVDNLN
jgi:Mg2+ and Co2+ transporter CorA